MKSGIYQIRNMVNGKVYVGSSIDMGRREPEHFRCLRSGRHVNISLQRAWVKYGADAFVFEVLEVVPDVGNLVPREQHWIDTLHSVKLGYNFAPVAGNTLGVKLSAEVRAKMSKRMTGTKHSAETRQKIRVANLGKSIDPALHQKMLDAAKSPEAIAKRVAKRVGYKHSDETKRKMAEARVGRKHSPETIQKMRGRVVSDETRKLKSEIASGKRHKPETIAKMTGRTFSDETRKRMSEAAKARTDRKRKTLLSEGS